MLREEFPKIAVVYGGPSAEAEVSKKSAKGVSEGLLQKYKNVQLLELSPQLPAELVKHEIDVVFPVTHGCPGEDGTLQGLLEIMMLPYVGSGVLASACSMDKITAKQLFKLAQLPIADDWIVSVGEGVDIAAARVYENFSGRTVIKPVLGGSAIGTAFCDNQVELEQNLTNAFSRESRVLVERYVRGKEITVALLETDKGVEVLPIVEIRTPEGSWYDYEHRYTPGWSEHIIPAPLPENQYKRIESVAKDAFRILQCRDWARADFVVPEEGEPILLEMNTIPGMTATSLYPDAAKAAGWDYPELLSHFIKRAMNRKAVYTQSARK